MTSSRHLRVAALATTAALLAAGCGGGTEPDGSTGGSSSGPGGTLRIGIDFTIDNWETFDKPNTTFISAVYEPLIDLAPDGATLTPRLATEWTQTPTSVTLKLRQGVLFHDGSAFDAEAVKVNLDRVGTTNNPYQQVMEPISAVVVKDPHTVVLELKRPYPTLLARLARRAGYMLNPKTIKDGSYKQNPSGTAPWKYDDGKSVRGSKLVFEYFDRYYAPAEVGPRQLVFHTIADLAARYNALATDQVDVASLQPAYRKKLESTPNVKYQVFAGLRYHFLFFDRARTFADPKVRQAVCTALDVKAIMAAQYEGLGELHQQRFDQGQAGFDPSVTGYPHDVTKAKDLMSQAGNPKLSFDFPAFPGADVLGELVRDQLGAIGMTVRVDKMNTSQFFSTFDTGKYPSAYNTSDDEATGPYDYYEYRFSKNGGGNPLKVNHPDLDAIAARGLAEADPAKQAEIWKEITRYINDQALDCGYFDRPQIFAWNTKKVDNVITTKYQPSVFRYAAAKAKG